MNDNLLWKDKKRPIFGLPISFTNYELREENLIIRTGILNIKEEDIRLFRIMDITVRYSIFDKLFNVGSIICHSADVSSPEFEICKVREPKKVKELLAKLVDVQRSRYGVRSGEYMNNNIMN